MTGVFIFRAISGSPLPFPRSQVVLGNADAREVSRRLSKKQYNCPRQSGSQVQLGKQIKIATPNSEPSAGIYAARILPHPSNPVNHYLDQLSPRKLALTSLG